MQRDGFPKAEQNPAVAVFTMGVSIFFMELLIMVILESLPANVKALLPSPAWDIIDPVMLSIFISPLLYSKLLKPMRAKPCFANELPRYAQQFRRAVSRHVNCGTGNTVHALLVNIV